MLFIACVGAPAGPVAGGAPGAGAPLLVVSDRGGAWRVYEVGADGASRLIGSPEISDTAYQDGMPARLPDSRTVFVSDRDGAPALYLAAPGSRAAARLFEAGSGGADSAPAPLGPDRVVFARRDRGASSGSPRDLYSARLDGKDLRRLTSNPADEGAPSGSRDGRAVVFVSDRAGAPHLFLIADLTVSDPEAGAIDLSIATSGGRRAERVGAAGESPATLSGPVDGGPILLEDQSIIFSRSSRGAPPQLFLMGRAGSGMAIRQVTDRSTLRYGAREPVLREDGSILFVTGPAPETGLHAVYEVTAGGFNLNRLSRDHARYSDFTRHLQ